MTRLSLYSGSRNKRFFSVSVRKFHSRPHRVDVCISFFDLPPLIKILSARYQKLPVVVINIRPHIPCVDTDTCIRNDTASEVGSPIEQYIQPRRQTISLLRNLLFDLGGNQAKNRGLPSRSTYQRDCVCVIARRAKVREAGVGKYEGLERVSLQSSANEEGI